MVLFGLVGGLIFGLAVAYGLIGGLGILIGMGVCLAGSFFPSAYRGIFVMAIFGFLVSWMVYGGLEIL